VVSQPNCVTKGVARSGAYIVIAPAVDMLGRGVVGCTMWTNPFLILTQTRCGPVVIIIMFVGLVAMVVIARIFIVSVSIVMASAVDMC